MRKSAFIVPVLLAIACNSTRTASTSIPPTPPIDAQRILSQHGADAILWGSVSAEAHRSFQQCFELAHIRLDQNLARVTSGIPAVIVDIDETVLDNSLYEIHLVANEKLYEDDSWKQWTAMARARAIPGSLEFLLHVAEKGCEVYYISNRHVSEGEATIRNLKDLGFPFADQAHLLLMEESSDKTARRNLVSDKHPIVLLVGDQLRDFDEAFKDRSQDHGRTLVDDRIDTLSRYFILLPNAMYGTWRDAIQGKGTPAEKLDRANEFFKRNSY